MENKQTRIPPSQGFLQHRTTLEDQIITPTLRLQKEIASVTDSPPPIHLPSRKAEESPPTSNGT